MGEGLTTKGHEYTLTTEIPAYAGMTMKIYFRKKRRGKHMGSHFRGNDVCRAAFSLQAESTVIPA